MKTLLVSLAVLAAVLLGGCQRWETNEEEAARFEAAERAQGYPAREGLRPGSQGQ